MSIIVDLDDFCEDNTSWELLCSIKEQIPQFKVTLFTIVGRCSNVFIEEMKSVSWVDIVPHGFLHMTNHECEHWAYSKALDYLNWLERFDLTKGFKAPGWLISEGTYRALLEKEYWVADQAYNIHRRPEHLPVYLLDAPNKIHGHIGHLNGTNVNELSMIMPEILKHKEETFEFVKYNV